MKTFILFLAVMAITCGTSYAATKTIYPVSALKIHASQKTVYGIYPNNKYWAVVKKPKITRLTKAVVMTYPRVPYHVKLFMRFNSAH